MNKILLVFKKELKEMFRDKKSLAMMLIIPLLIPCLVIGMAALFNSEINKPIEEYNKIGFNYQLNEIENEIIKQLNIEAVYAPEDILKEKYEQEEINLYITKEDNKYILNGKDDENSTLARNLSESYLASYKNYLQTNYLREKNIIPELVTNIITWETNILEEDNFFSSYITVYAFLFIIMAITVSATYPATDATAGEKERGTLETLLTFPLKSKDIIIGKFLGVSFSSIITGIISLILTIISLKIANNSFTIFESSNLMLSNISLFFLIIVIITYSFLISGLCIAIASKSKNFKEAQGALTPLTFISFFPSMIAFMMNLKSNVVLSLIPFLNSTLIFTDIVNNEINILNICLMVLTNIIFIGIVLFIIIKQYKSEKVLF